MSTKHSQNLAYLNTLDLPLKKALTDIAVQQDIPVEAVVAIFRSAYGNVKRLIREADDNAWPTIFMAGLGIFRPNLTRTYRAKTRYYATSLKLRFKYKLLGSKPSTYHPQGIPDHLWE